MDLVRKGSSIGVARRMNWVVMEIRFTKDKVTTRKYVWRLFFYTQIRDTIDERTFGITRNVLLFSWGTEEFFMLFLGAEILCISFFLEEEKSSRLKIAYPKFYLRVPSFR